jgi:hypothetical protein
MGAVEEHEVPPPLDDPIRQSIDADLVLAVDDGTSQLLESAASSCAP